GLVTFEVGSPFEVGPQWDTEAPSFDEYGELLGNSSEKSRVGQRRGKRRSGRELARGGGMKRQNILVTGCSGRLARHAAVALARRGHWVFATMPDCFGLNVAAARNLQNVGVMKGYQLEVLEMDVVDQRAVDRAVSSVVHRSGHI